MTKVVWADLDGFPVFDGEDDLRRVCDAEFHYDFPDISTFVDRCRDAEVVVWGWVDLQAEVLDQLPNLKMAVYLGVSQVHQVDAHAQAKGITVTNTPGYGDSTVAEHALGLMQALARHILPGHASMRRGQWVYFEGTDLKGSTLGIVGLGGVGGELAAMANALGMRVICHTRHPSQERARQHRVEFVELDELLSTSDFIQLNMILSDETREMIGARELDLIRPGAYLINTARSAVVDQEALIERLSDRRLAGYTTDVYSQEPPEDEPLRHLDNVILTPHLGFQTAGAKHRMLAIATDNVLAYLNGTNQNVVI